MRLKVVERFWIVYTLLIGACSTPGLADEIKDHCLPGEEVYFSCLMKNEKTLSLCGSKKVLSYRYGHANNLELVFPDAAPLSMTRFKYNNYFRYGIDYYRVSFLNGQYNYHIYRDIDNELTPKMQAGILVENSSSIDKREIDLPCTERVSDNLNKLSEFLECDQESALGCAD